MRWNNLHGLLFEGQIWRKRVENEIQTLEIHNCEFLSSLDKTILFLYIGSNVELDLQTPLPFELVPPLFIIFFL